LGKLGAPLAACLATKGFRVIGVDADAQKVKDINRGMAPVYEPGLEDLLRIAEGRISATEDAEAAVLESDLTFIVLPTPSEPDGGFSLRHVLPTCEVIGRTLNSKQEFHLIVLTSTVMPGSTGGAVRPILEQVSRKRCGQDFGLCYSPEFIALGSVIRDFLNPDFLLIGESDSRSGDMLEALYKDVCENGPPVARMNFVNAELTKLAINAFVTTKITFANMLARICERLPEADVDVVTAALGLDSRIGRKYLKGAIGYGGPCFPRDNVAMASQARRVGAPAVLPEATETANRGEVLRLAELIKSKMVREGVVGILGLAYKPNTDVVEESQGLLLAQALISEGIPVIAYDPAAMPNGRGVLGDRIRFASSAKACIHEADIVVLATAWEEFRKLESFVFARRSRPRIVIDCWRALELSGQDGVEYLPLGIGPVRCTEE